MKMNKKRKITTEVGELIYVAFVKSGVIKPGQIKQPAPKL